VLVTVAVMGASERSARSSYRHDISAALLEARWDAYKRGDFYRVAPDEQARSMSEREYVAWGIEQTKASAPAEVAGLEWGGDE